MRHEILYSKSHDGRPIDLTHCLTAMQQEPSPKVSSKYSFIPTTRAIDVIKDYGFFPTFYRCAGVRNSDNAGYNTHELRFRDPHIILPGDCYAEIGLKNNHSASRSFEIWLAVYRKICSNGLTTSDNYESFRIRHIGFTEDKVAAAIEAIVSQAPRLADGIRKLQGIETSETSAFWFAKKAAQLRHDQDNIFVDPGELTRPVRYDGDNGNLWGIFNTVQERLINGLYRYDRKGKKGTWSKVKAKRINSIELSKKLNSQLWSLAENWTNQF